MEFSGNSYKERNNSDNKEEKVITPVTSNVTVKKPSEMSKFGKRIFAEDAKSVGSHVIDSVFIPSLQKLISDIVKNGIDWFIYGVKGVSQNSGGVRNVSYSSYYDRSRPSQQAPQRVTSTPAIFAINDVTFGDRGEAEEVLLKLREVLDRYHVVSVNEFYEFINQPCEFTANKYGWRDLSTANVVRRGSGYAIAFPKVTPIE